MGDLETEMTTDMQQIDLEDFTRAEPVIQPSPESKKSSGYRRLQVRHRALISDHEALRSDYEALQIEQESLQRDVDRLLAEHRRLIQEVRLPQAVAQPWFETANQVLAQLAAKPEPRALDVMTAAVAGLLQRLSQIRMGVPR